MVVKKGSVSKTYSTDENQQKQNKEIEECLTESSSVHHYKQALFKIRLMSYYIYLQLYAVNHLKSHSSSCGSVLNKHFLKDAFKMLIDSSWAYPQDHGQLFI